MKILTRTGVLFLALLLAFCLALQPVLAEGVNEPPSETADSGAPPPAGGDETNVTLPGPTPEPASTPEPTPTPEPASTPESNPTPAPEPETVSTWSELIAWLDGNWCTGGTVRLDADVTADGLYDLMSGKQVFRAQPMTIDCGEHTIYIETEPGEPVSLTACGFKLTIQGKGGEAGLLHVRRGGALMLDMLNIVAEEGNAVVQAEGGVLIVTQEDTGYQAPPRVTGELVYAQRPVLTYQDFPGAHLAVIPDGQPLTEDLLPGSAKAVLNYRGELSDALAQPVVWDTETDSLRLERRERTVLTGRPAAEAAWNGRTWAEGEYEVHGAPTCIAAFLEDGAALLELYMEQTSWFLHGDIYFRVEPGAQTLRLLASPDEGNTWVEQASLSGAESAETEIGHLKLYLEPPSYPIWLLVEAVYPDGRIVHTDTVSVTEDQVKPATWSDGHRGGGEPILPPSDQDSSGLTKPPPIVTDTPPDADPPGEDSNEKDPPAGNLPDDGGSVDDQPPEDTPPDDDSVHKPPHADPPQSGVDDGPDESVTVIMPPAEKPTAESTPVPSEPQAGPSEEPPQTAPAETASSNPEPSPAPQARPSSEPPQGAAPADPPATAGGEAAPPTGPTSIVPPAADAVQSAPAVPALGPGPTAGPEATGVLPPAAQVALGGTAAAALGVGAVSCFNPKLIRRLLRKLSKRLHRK